MSAKPFLLDGPLMLAPERRAAMVETMARELYDALLFADRGDSIRFLLGRGYPAIDIMLLVDDARQAAVQEIVAKEMGDAGS